MTLLDFVAYGQLPAELNLVPEDIRNLATMRAKFTPTAGMNEPTSGAPSVPSTTTSPAVSTTSSMFTSMTPITTTHASTTPSSIAPAATRRQPEPESDPNTPWWSSTLTSGGTIPTEYLAQLPSNWPYTEYGIARKVGKTTSWPLVNPNATSSTVAWVYHELLWNPRPLFTPAAEKAKKGEMYNPQLDGWKHDFLYETITPSVALPESTSSISGSGFRPSNSQSPVLSGNEAARAATLSAITARVTGTAEAAALSELAEEVRSMKSRLNA
jgi:hypothetical protein